MAEYITIIIFCPIFRGTENKRQVSFLYWDFGGAFANGTSSIIVQSFDNQKRPVLANRVLGHDIGLESG